MPSGRPGIWFDFGSCAGVSSRDSPPTPRAVSLMVCAIEADQFPLSGISMMCAQGFPGFMSQGEPVEGVVERPVVSAVAYGI